jgi:hypothetical protein
VITHVAQQQPNNSPLIITIIFEAQGFQPILLVDHCVDVLCALCNASITILIILAITTNQHTILFLVMIF